jgi:LysR family transcriptional activator of nhaA
MLNYNHVYYFHVAASEGSVARAAERLGVTQPTVSEQIRQLERTLGVTLFERTTSGIRPTDAGRQAYEHTTAMFRAGERLMEALGRGPAALPRTLRVGVSAAVSRTIATDFLLPLFTMDECLPSIRSGEYTDLLRDLRGHELDLVLCEAEPSGPAARGLETCAIVRPRLVAVAAPSREVSPDWADLPLIQYRASSAYRWEVEAYVDDHNLNPRIVAEADDALMMIEAAVRGGGIAFVPRSVARDAIASGRVKVLATLEPGSAAVHALYHGADTPELATQAVKRLLDYAQTIEH